MTGSPESFAQLKREFELDVGSRGPHFEVNPNGKHAVEYHPLLSEGFKYGIEPSMRSWVNP